MHFSLLIGLVLGSWCSMLSGTTNVCIEIVVVQTFLSEIPFNINKALEQSIKQLLDWRPWHHPRRRKRPLNRITNMFSNTKIHSIQYFYSLHTHTLNTTHYTHSATNVHNDIQQMTPRSVTLGNWDFSVRWEQVKDRDWLHRGLNPDTTGLRASCCCTQAHRHVSYRHTSGELDPFRGSRGTPNYSLTSFLS